MSPVILVVDRDEETRQILRAYLEHHGHHVFATGDGDEALQLAAEHDPGVVVGDFPMDVRGHSPFVTALRNEIGSDAPVLLFSPRATDEEVAAAREVIQHVLTKPAAPSEVLEAVEQLLNGRG